MAIGEGRRGELSVKTHDLATSVCAASTRSDKLSATVDQIAGLVKQLTENIIRDNFQAPNRRPCKSRRARRRNGLESLRLTEVLDFAGAHA